MIFAVAGKSISAVTVQHITQSISRGSIPLFLHRSKTAGSPRSEVAFPSPFNILLSTTPVRVRIHSSFVSTICSRSLFVNLSSGTYPPTAVIAAVILLFIFCMLLMYRLQLKNQWPKIQENELMCGRADVQMCEFLNVGRSCIDK